MSSTKKTKKRNVAKVTKTEVVPTRPPAPALPVGAAVATTFVLGLLLGGVFLGPVFGTSSLWLSHNPIPPPGFGGTTQSLPASSIASSAAPTAVEEEDDFSGEPFVQSRVQVTSVLKSAVGGSPTPVQIVVRSPEELRRVWEELAGNGLSLQPPPAVDFDQELVVGVFSGNKPTGGYDIEISYAILTDDELRLHATQTEPGQGCAVTQQQTSPFHLVRIPRTELGIRFLISRTLVSC